ncbi:chaperone NapD [Caldithrix abyssi]|uniref:NapD protein n=1 Tax=Caldithrix abyssi DSM 13497 TaxID=880073 RepID=H1XYE8_CALAY|nr:chaperone NapD [Caldithrix abyssi]APF19310.1 NapD protein [Caldithrix abyssi DSM 13497]EHO43215.1 hypothetical protein Calab_3617 [Caldithrix abyssi DSM 13497]
MAIAGVAILTKKEEVQKVYQRLEQLPEITTYGIHEGHYIVAVIETTPQTNLKAYLEEVQNNDPAILGIYPAYVNFEDEVSEIEIDQKDA